MCSTIVKTAKRVLNMILPMCIVTKEFWLLQILHISLQKMEIFSLFHRSHYGGCTVEPQCCPNLNFLMINMVKELFICL